MSDFRARLYISHKLSLCLGFVNLESQTNKLHNVLTLHNTLYTVKYVQYRPESILPEMSQGRGPM